MEGFDIKEITSMKNLFYRTSLKTIDFEGFDTSNVEDISFMLSYSDINNFDLSKSAKNMPYMFFASSVTSLNL